VVVCCLLVAILAVHVLNAAHCSRPLPCFVFSLLTSHSSLRTPHSTLQTSQHSTTTTSTTPRPRLPARPHPSRLVTGCLLFVCLFMYLLMYSRVHVLLTLLPLSIHTHIHIHTHKHTHTHTHKHTHTYTHSLILHFAIITPHSSIHISHPYSFTNYTFTLLLIL
jgi:hypothetical protein